MKKKIILVGGRNKAKQLATSLLNKKYEVTVINKEYEDCEILAEIPNINVIHGDGTKPYILDSADAANTDIIIALTPRDEDNLVICELSKKKFNIGKTVSLVSDPKKTDFFYKMGIDNVVCAMTTIANIIEQEAFLDEIANIVPIGEGKVKIVEVKIEDNDISVGKKLWEITMPSQSIVGCIMRDNVTVIPRGDTRLLANDTAVILSASGCEIEAIKALKGGMTYEIR